MVGLGAACVGLPSTSRSKSSSVVVVVLELLKPLGALEERLRDGFSADPLLADNSWSFLLCSRSIREESDLMRSIYD